LLITKFPTVVWLIRVVIAQLDFPAIFLYRAVPPNGSRYPLVGGTRQRRFAGTHSKPKKLLENAQTPTSRVHALLAGILDCRVA
jgi:hypothetical protein